MNWHKPTELPTPDTEVLAEVSGFTFAKFTVLRHDEFGWWQHMPKLGEFMCADGWVGTQGLEVIRWAYIEKDN